MRLSLFGRSGTGCTYSSLLLAYGLCGDWSKVALIDTEARSLQVLDLPEGVRYTFRDIARGPDDKAYILASDGSIHVLDPASGELVDAFPVVEPWESPVEWQDPHPAIVVAGDIAYVTEPAAAEIHAVDLTSGEVVATATIDATPNEIAACAKKAGVLPSGARGVGEVMRRAWRPRRRPA